MTELDPLNPLAPPGRRLEGVREVLRLMHDLAISELHDAHCVCWSALVADHIFRDPQISRPKNSLDVEARRLAWMVTSQGLQITPPEDTFTRLGIVTNSIVIVDIVFSVRVAGGGGAPVHVQSFTYLMFLHELLQVRSGSTIIDLGNSIGDRSRPREKLAALATRRPSSGNAVRHHDAAWHAKKGVNVVIRINFGLDRY
jgi:hypothetical protein